MAYFRGKIISNTGEVSRPGNKQTGLATTCNGRSGGVSVDADHSAVINKDIFRVDATTGSGCGKSDGTVGYVIDGKWYTPKQFVRLLAKATIKAKTEKLKRNPLPAS